MKKIMNSIAGSFAVVAMVSLLFMCGCGKGKNPVSPAAPASGDLGRLSVKVTFPKRETLRVADQSKSGTVNVRITVTGYYLSKDEMFDPVVSETTVDLAAGHGTADVMNVPVGKNHIVEAFADWGGGTTATIKGLITELSDKKTTMAIIDSRTTVVANAAIAHANENARFLRDVDLSVITSIEEAVDDMQTSGLSFTDMIPADILTYVKAKPVISSINITPASVALPPGGTQQFSALVSKTDSTTVTGAVIKWSVDSPSIGSISATGLFTATSTVATGTVTASYGSLRATAAITITGECGNGVVDSGEACDDGNVVTETCSYGQTSCTVCDATCASVAGVSSFCGDGSIDGTNGETCDDSGETASCNSDCTLASCGDDVTNTAAGETCDDGNTVGGDGCATDCSAETLATNAWVTIPAGDFVMGCADADLNCNVDGREAPKHTVTLSEYKIQKYEVTNLQYAECVTDGACTVPSSDASLTRVPYYGDAAYDDYPVIYVNWTQAAAYCAWKGGRLPTEAEWTKAARGPSPREPIYAWGDMMPDCTLAEYGGSSTCTGDTSAVGAHPDGASYYGLMDMTGNVTEWVSDWYDITYYSTGGPMWMDPPGGAGTQRIVSGGAFRSNTTSMRISNRRGVNPASTYDYAGLRCLKDGPEIPICGNSVVETGETCDDGNAVAETCAYGSLSCTVCNATCQSAAGETSYCGDGVTDAGNSETCDDGNTVDGDGCSAICAIELATTLFDSYTVYTAVRQTSDGGYIVAGNTDPTQIYMNDAIIVKFDADFNQVWSQTYGLIGEQEDTMAVVEALDGGYVMAGESGPGPANTYRNAWVRKYDTSGNLAWSFLELWNDTFCGGTTYGYLMVSDLVLDADGGYMLIGESWACSGPASTSSYWMLKLDQSGSEVFKGIVGDGVSGDEPSAIETTSDSGYIVTGNRWMDNGSGTWIYKMFVTKFDSSRNEVWTQLFGASTDNTKGTAVSQTPDGGYIVSGNIEPGQVFSTGGYLYTVKLDSAGTLVWEHTISSGFYKPNSIQLTSDGGYAIAGQNHYSGGAWIVKLDSSGNLVSNEIQGTNSAAIRDMRPTADGGFIVAGQDVDWTNYQGNQGWLYLLDANLQ